MDSSFFMVSYIIIIIFEKIYLCWEMDHLRTMIICFKKTFTDKTVNYITSFSTSGNPFRSIYLGQWPTRGNSLFIKQLFITTGTALAMTTNTQLLFTNFTQSQSSSYFEEIHFIPLNPRPQPYEILLSFLPSEIILDNIANMVLSLTAVSPNKLINFVTCY